MVEAIDPFDAESDVGARAVVRAPILLVFGKTTDAFYSEAKARERRCLRVGMRLG